VTTVIGSIIIFLRSFLCCGQRDRAPMLIAVVAIAMPKLAGIGFAGERPTILSIPVIT
jgi:hypothetical protein